MSRIIFSAWVYLTIGWLFAAFFSEWAKVHCPGPEMSVEEGAITAMMYPAIIPAAIVWGLFTQPSKFCTK